MSDRERMEFKRREFEAIRPAFMGPPDDATECPMCGQPVRVVGTDEGTQHYEAATPSPDALREALLAALRDADDADMLTEAMPLEDLSEYLVEHGAVRATLATTPEPTYTEVERLDRPGNRADLTPEPASRLAEGMRYAAEHVNEPRMGVYVTGEALGRALRQQLSKYGMAFGWSHEAVDRFTNAILANLAEEEAIRYPDSPGKGRNASHADPR